MEQLAQLRPPEVSELHCGGIVPVCDLISAHATSQIDAMKIGKETKRAVNIHRQQLFYWMVVAAYGLALPFTHPVAAAFWNSRRTSLVSLLGQLARCTIRT